MNKAIFPICICILSANGLNAQIASYSGIDKMIDESKRFIDMKKEIKIDKEALQACIEYLQEKPKVEFNPYPDYDGRVQVALGLLVPDYEYLKNHEALKNMPINKMSIDNIRTMLTFINRGERFCDGHIALFVENGCLLELLLRLSELTKE